MSLINATVSCLENGLRVVTAPMPQSQSVAVGILVGVGGRHEAAHQAGISHFIEHLLFKGTETLSASAISRAIEGRGGYCNAYTQEEDTCYYVKTPAAGLAQAFRIINEMYLHPRFAPRDIERERGVIVDEIMMYRDQPDQVVEETLSAQLFPRHGLGRPLTGTPKTLAHLRREDLLRFKADHYVPANTVVALAGRIDPDYWVEQVRRRTAAMQPQPAPRLRPFAVRVAPRPMVACIDKTAEQAHLALGFRTFGRRDHRRHALRLLNVIIGESMSSRLFQIVRERRGLVYAINSSSQLFRETGELVVTASADVPRIETVVRLIIRELRRLRETPVPPPELRRAIDYAAGQIQLGLESTSGQMMWSGGSVLHLGGCIAPEEVINDLRAVTPSDLQALATYLLCPERAAVALVGPGASKLYDRLTLLLKELS